MRHRPVAFFRQPALLASPGPQHLLQPLRWTAQLDGRPSCTPATRERCTSLHSRLYLCRCRATSESSSPSSQAHEQEVSPAPMSAKQWANAVVLDGDHDKGGEGGRWRCVRNHTGRGQREARLMCNFSRRSRLPRRSSPPSTPFASFVCPGPDWRPWAHPRASPPAVVESRWAASSLPPCARAAPLYNSKPSRSGNCTQRHFP